VLNRHGPVRRKSVWYPMENRKPAINYGKWGNLLKGGQLP
jgi:hypothetical protein